MTAPPHHRRRVLFTAAGTLAVTATAGALLTDGRFWKPKAAGASGVAPAVWAEPSPASEPTPTGAPPAAPEPAGLTGADPASLVRISTSAWHSWALLDKASGRITGSADMAKTNKTASMIKAWLAADYLRRAAEAGKTPSAGRMNELRSMIRDSANEPANTIFRELGYSASTKRAIQICGLTDSKATGDWSGTLLSARDTCRIGLAISSGLAAGPQWTSWLLTEMQAVRGGGNFGIRKAFPADQQAGIAIKNGWITRAATSEWTVNCLAIGSTWTMAVLTRYPSSRSMTVGADLALNIASQLRLNVPLQP